MRKLLKKIFLSEKVIMAAIVFTAVILFILSFPSIKGAKPYSWQYCIHLIDDVLIVFFAVEAIVKICHFSWKEYWASNWNKFDFLIVIFSLPAMIPPPLLTFLPITLQKTSVILMLRLLRLVRLFRFLEFIPHLNQLMQGLKRAFKASVLVLGVLIALNFVLAIVSCHFFDRSDLFADPMTASYTIFQLFTLEGWNDVPKQVIKDLDAEQWKRIFIRFYFVALVLTGGIFGVSIANAIFVDEMTIDNNIELEKKIDHLNAKIEQLTKLLQPQQVEAIQAEQIAEKQTTERENKT